MQNLMDPEGENLAVRAFLMQYTKPGITIGEMRRHMQLSGHDGRWPDWAGVHQSRNLHLTKEGAQDWLRHLFNLEKTNEQNNRKGAVA